jgi:hypothetical protein
MIKCERINPNSLKLYKHVSVWFHKGVFTQVKIIAVQ